MKTDRELLELAAKAPGYTLVWGDNYIVDGDNIDCTDLPYVRSDQQDEADWYWDPLTDDGDALRLAVKLHLCLMFPMQGERFKQCGAGQVGGSLPACWEPHDPDPLAATRRAIVRAAAAIGESMP